MPFFLKSDSSYFKDFMGCCSHPKHNDHGVVCFWLLFKKPFLSTVYAFESIGVGR